MKRDILDYEDPLTEKFRLAFGIAGTPQGMFAPIVLQEEHFKTTAIALADDFNFSVVIAGTARAFSKAGQGWSETLIFHDGDYTQKIRQRFNDESGPYGDKEVTKNLEEGEKTHALQIINGVKKVIMEYKERGLGS